MFREIGREVSGPSITLRNLQSSGHGAKMYWTETLLPGEILGVSVQSSFLKSLADRFCQKAQPSLSLKDAFHCLNFAMKFAIDSIETF